MFEPDVRLVLAEALRPPPGYVLDRAVATTFTLDLTAALIAPLALGSLNAGDAPDPIAVMESIRAVADRVDIFCQAGNIGVPQQASDLMAFLEPMVHEVRRPRPGFLFHPKLWILRYVDPDDDEPAALRVLCGSRNLTLDRSWDLLLRLDGEVGRRNISANRPLRDLVLALPGMTIRPLDRDRRAGVESLATDVRRAEWDLPADVNDLAFHVLGIRGQTRPDFAGTRHLVISPFVNDRGLASIVETSDDAVLVSRAEELARLADDTFGWFGEIHTVNSLAELDGPETGDGITMSGLHAKAVIVDYNRTAHVFVGSMNATEAAQTGNVEVLVELIGSRRRLGVGAMLADDSPFRTLLEPFDPGSAVATPEEDWTLEEDLRALAEVPFTLTVAPAGDGYRLTISHGTLPGRLADVAVSAALLTRPAVRRRLGTAEAPCFDGVSLADITPFVVLLVVRGSEQRSTVVGADLIGDPADRLDAVLARQIDTPEKLLRFLFLILQLAQGGGDLAIQATGDADGLWGGAFEGGGSGLLELVVRVLADRPAALDDVERLIERMERTSEGRALLPDGFENFWAAVRSARATMQEAPA